MVITGADGFIGSHLVEALMDAGAKVTAFVYYNSFGSWGWLDSFAPNIRTSMNVVMGDIRDPRGVREILKSHDIVFHLAALIGIPYSYHSPDNYIDTNIKGTLNVLNAARDFEFERVLVTSTSEVYGTALYTPIDEKHPRQGQSPYSATKIGADALAESYYRSFGIPITIVRPFNTYGPRQSARAIIPTIISQLLSGQKEIRLGNMTPRRDLTYCKDTAMGFVKLAECDDAVGKEVNICNSKEISMGDLATLLIEMINPSATIQSDEDRLRPEKSEVERLLGSNTLLSELTGWVPSTPLNVGLADTIKFVKKNLAHYKPEIYNV